ncbi:LysR family transcriptional regulator [Shewanella aegiceratis]|uniref:LysR family transcriptional regulator n=1 Tax=Shewanella aegiceratis TaxID=2864203 RepID=UPI001C65AA7C|nr:LysR family transcriptional regulator [Shewanella aegiceratis]QYJ83230.1 LysR family transcriptional regulator [Shewanella aegiceratis]
MDKISAIRSFVEVASCGSFTQAAEQLGLSRLQVSRHIQEVERWLGLRLLHRTTRSVSLSVQGEEAFIYCQKILDEVAALQNRAQRHRQELVGSIRIASPIGLGQALLFDAIDDFTREHPEVKVQLLLSDEMVQLVDERVDIALRYTQQPDESLIARRLMHIDSVLCASPDYLAGHAPITSLDDITAHNCLLHASQTRWLFVKDNQNIEKKVGGNLQANDMGVLIKAALRGKGLIHLPCDLANAHLASGALVELLPEYHLPGKTLWAVYLSRSYQQHLIRHFIDFLAERWQQDILKQPAQAR